MPNICIRQVRVCVLAPRWTAEITYGLPSSSIRRYRLNSTDKYVHIDKNGAAANNNSFNVRVRADHVVLHFRARD